MPDLADIVRGEAPQYLQTRFTTPVQRKALRDIANCRTELMGIVPETCDDCGEKYRLFQSCGNRNCPQCQTEARAEWLAARQDELLPVEYLHVVFNVPAALRHLALESPRAFYEAVMRAAGQAVVSLGEEKLGAQLACHVHLHTWTRSMVQHVHCHCVIPCGAFSEDGTKWLSFEPSALRAKDLARRFRRLLCRAILEGAQQGEYAQSAVSIEKLLRRVATRRWRVYAERPFGGPERLLAYLAQNMYRIAISNDRIVSYEDHQVTFTARDPATGSVLTYTLDGQEFLRRFLLHVLPRGFVRVRSYGFLANRNRNTNLERARRLIGKVSVASAQKEPKRERLCPACHARKYPERARLAAPSPDLAPQMSFEHRPPPVHSTAA